MIDHNIPNNRTIRKPAREINNWKNVALKQMTIEHVLYENCAKLQLVARRKWIIYTMDIQIGLLSDELRLLEVLWIYLINMIFFQVLLVIVWKPQNMLNFLNIKPAT